MTYDAANRRLLRQVANGTRASHTYDLVGQLTEIANLKSDDLVISTYKYTYDPAGNRLTVLESTGDRVTYQYDTTNQLINESRSGAHTFNTTFTYDAVGNRLVKNETGARTTSTYDAANQLVNSQDSIGLTAYTFDANGNQQIVLEPNGSRTTYGWDYENQNTLVVMPMFPQNTVIWSRSTGKAPSII